MPVAYVFQLGQTGVFKVGKAESLSKRQSTYETISTEELILYAEIETTNKSAVETFIKHRLQSHRWLDGAGRELYKPPEDYLDEVIAAATRWNAEMLPKLAEVGRLTKQSCDGRVLKPSELVQELYVELLEWRQKELTARQEMTRISTEIQLVMQTASEIEGVAVWKNKPTTTFQTSRLKKERRDIYDAYALVTQTRPFTPRW
jgi:Meiotically up-regulated gene 113